MYFTIFVTESWYYSGMVEKEETIENFWKLKFT